MKPSCIRCTSSVQEDMNVFLEILNPTRLNGILLGIIWFTELVLDEKLTINLIHFFFSIVAMKGRW